MWFCANILVIQAFYVIFNSSGHVKNLDLYKLASTIATNANCLIQICFVLILQFATISSRTEKTFRFVTKK